MGVWEYGSVGMEFIYNLLTADLSILSILPYFHTILLIVSNSFR